MFGIFEVRRLSHSHLARQIHYESQTLYSLRNIVSVPRFSGTSGLILRSVISGGIVSTMSWSMALSRRSLS
jgi:hypothetical protein